MFRTFQCVSLVVVLLAFPVVAHAGYVPLLVNSSSKAVVFDDNYEGQTLGSSPTGAATVGTWTSNLASGDEYYVSSAATSGNPAAYEGTQYLMLNRPSSPPAGNGSIVGAGITSRSGATDTITMTAAFYMKPDSLNTVGESTLYAVNGQTELTEIGFWTNGDGSNTGVVKFYNGGSSWQGPLTQTFALNQWNTMTLTHVNGSNAFSISINGATAETIGAYAGLTGVWDGIKFQNDAYGAHMYWDATPVPEPMAFVMAVPGVFGLLAYAWRKHK